MPVLPIANSFSRLPANCVCSGIEKISLIPIPSINWTAAQASPGLYYNTGSFTTTPLPVVTGANYILFDAYKDSLRVEIKYISKDKTEVTISGSFEFNCSQAIRIDQLRSQCGFLANVEMCSGSQMIIGAEPTSLVPSTAPLVPSNLEGGRLNFTKFDWDSGTMRDGITSVKGTFEMKGMFQFYPKCTAGFQTLNYLPA